MSAELVRRFFRAADSRDAAGFVQVLTPDVRWVFGNAPALHGREAVREALSGFFSYVREMDHEIVGIWESPECITAETRVRYVDQFGRTFSFPGCDLLFLSGNLFREVRIFVDNHELFLPPA